MIIRTHGAQVAIESRRQIPPQALQRCALLVGNQSSLVGSAKEVARFVKRAASNPDESFVINRRSAAVALSDIGADTIGRANDLMSDSGPGKRIPLRSRIPYEVGQLLGHGVYFQAFERELGHGEYS